ncbi:hypothetical protein [Candidatus Cyanaurora vandensis]|uniref:hypothetical protein n=1 Tax=Candidatus Cyanaurora vandensis TaxID=2714958 RepID=UPI002579571D|nr:hypothetical protein [Candidatus Cyanaurora vandensis]
MDADHSGLRLTRRALVVGLGGLVVAPVWAETGWLDRYQLALAALKAPSTLQFTQQAVLSGWQEGDMQLSFRTSPGTWQARITELDRQRTLDRTQLDPVFYKSRLAIYNAYVTRPQRLAPEAVFPLMPTTEKIRTARAETWAGQPVNYLAFAGGVPIRELWLDPVRFLPRRIHWVDSGSYGTAEIFMDLGPVGEYWLPVASLVKIQLNFWVPQGFSARTFKGPLTIQTTYRDYQFRDQPPTSVPVEPEPLAQPTTRAALLAEESVPVPIVVRPTPSTPFNLQASTTTSSSVIADRIAAFNLSKPEVTDPYTHLNILLTLAWGDQRWQTYLFRFQTKTPLLPRESVSSENKSFPILGGN